MKLDAILPGDSSRDISKRLQAAVVYAALISEEDKHTSKAPQEVRNVDNGSVFGPYCYPNWLRYRLLDFKDQIQQQANFGTKHKPPYMLKQVSKELAFAFNPNFNYF